MKNESLFERWWAYFLTQTTGLTNEEQDKYKYVAKQAWEASGKIKFEQALMASADKM